MVVLFIWFIEGLNKKQAFDKNSLKDSETK